ncbi:hypothetical protein BD410DRAFT_381667 [Rickenella mellea]|uniref:F-box domain-containing protein n=1 Tax=Rickenella mellea TaxID=50990 RepID=A0A4Y7PY94_9AGAM|nr:hypothetical protein BD410DRAFT_381667 [Rickenella mellea]
MASHAIYGSCVLKLPVEVWRMVVISAVKSVEPMDNCHEASESLTTRFHLARRVTSKSPEYTLMLVCKTLNAIATEFFYERISIQSKKQLIALAAGLKSPRISENMAMWMRRFEFNYAAHTPVYNNHDKGLMVRVLRSCPNLTHLIIQVANHEYNEIGAKARDTTTIMDTCAKSCERLEVLHLALNLTTYKWADMTPGVFLKSFRNITILRLGNAIIATPRNAVVQLGELPFLHTFEACAKVHFLLLANVHLPLLSTVHFRNKVFPDFCYLPSSLLGFISAHGNKLTNLTLIGVAHEHPLYARRVVPLLLKCTRLQVFVTDVVDLVRLLPFDDLLLHKVTRLELTNYSPGRLPSTSSFRATLIADLRAHFPSLEELRWLGRVVPDVPSPNTRAGWDLSEGGTDAHHAFAAGIRIENRDGDKLELFQLLVQ